MGKRKMEESKPIIVRRRMTLRKGAYVDDIEEDAAYSFLYNNTVVGVTEHMAVTMEAALLQKGYICMEYYAKSKKVQFTLGADQ